MFELKHVTLRTKIELDEREVVFEITVRLSPLCVCRGKCLSIRRKECYPNTKFCYSLVDVLQLKINMEVTEDKYLSLSFSFIQWQQQFCTKIIVKLKNMENLSVFFTICIQINTKIFQLYNKLFLMNFKILPAYFFPKFIICVYKIGVYFFKFCYFGEFPSF